MMGAPVTSGLIWRGNVCIAEHDAVTGRLLSVETVPNKLVQSGRQFIAQVLKGDFGGRIAYAGWGSDNTAAVDSQTALLAEVVNGRFPITKITHDVNGQITVQQYIGKTQLNGNTLREVGLFDAPTAGFLIARAAISDKVKTTNSTLTLTWTLSQVST